ncbi:hypothetical protein [Peribacillus sp. SCS-155]|uniref:hypothetical protein n=1 Tax=Peribacillus sedimenti TaxID=3115297 RepID=UPI003906BB2B
MKKFIIGSCLALAISTGVPAITNIGVHETEAASVAGKSYSYYLSKSQAKSVYKSMKKAEKVGGWASIFLGLIAKGQAASVGVALSASSVGKKEVEKAYHKGMRLKVTYTYGVTMSLNKTTFKAVK